MFLVALAADAFGCSFAGPSELQPVPDAGDTVAPAAPVLVSVEVQRGKGARIAASSCDDLGWMTLTVGRPVGDPDAEEAVGYRFELVEGTLPDGFRMPTRDAAPWLGPDLFMSWIDDNTDEQEAFDFTVEIIPVDAAGNEGEPLTVDVSDPGRSPVLGCDTAGGVAGLWALGAALLLVRRRR